MKTIIRPEIKASTLSRLRKLDNYPPNTSIDWMINSALDIIESMKNGDRKN